MSVCFFVRLFFCPVFLVGGRGEDAECTDDAVFARYMYEITISNPTRPSRIFYRTRQGLTGKEKKKDKSKTI